MKTVGFNTTKNTCLHYSIRAMRGPEAAFNDIDRLCAICHSRLTAEEAERVKKEIERLRMTVKW